MGGIVHTILAISTSARCDEVIILQWVYTNSQNRLPNRHEKLLFVSWHYVNRKNTLIV